MPKEYTRFPFVFDCTAICKGALTPVETEPTWVSAPAPSPDCAMLKTYRLSSSVTVLLNPTLKPLVPTRNFPEGSPCTCHISKLVAENGLPVTAVSVQVPPGVAQLLPMV